MLRSLIRCALVVTAVMGSKVLAWGPIGHETVAYVAQQNLTTTAAESVKMILPTGKSMIDVANWADEVRTLPAFKWSAPLHFINTPDWTCDYVRVRDCYNEQHQFGYCVDGAIQNYTLQLKKHEYGSAMDALRFLIHFVGDVHQPLHCGFTSDQGGNLIKVRFNDRSTELHAVWDSGLIEERLKNDFDSDQQRWWNYLVTSYLPNLTTCVTCSSDWGNESVQKACTNAYVMEDGRTHIQPGDKLDQAYYARNIPVVEQALVTAGYRLSSLLNWLFS